eukprot:10015-Amorphochlora_amoeboformis.AAC.3
MGDVLTLSDVDLTVGFWVGVRCVCPSHLKLNSRIGRDVERKDGLGKLRARLAKKGLAGFDLEELF